jgi:fumarylacetoacetase
VLTSWVPEADGSGFPAEHLPFGVLSQPAEGGERRLRRVGVRIGDHVVDLARLVRERLVDGPFDQPVLNLFLSEGPERWRQVRARLTELLCDPAARHRVEPALVPLDRCRLHLPFQVADYVDFYSSIEHATNMGRMLRPDGEPLLPNWRHLPVAYHGRSATVVVTGTPVVRPQGPTGPGVFGPSQRLDVELEVGFVVGVPSAPSVPVAVDDAPSHVFGVVLVNDWSARDIQAWEGQPLGPFLGKSFATSAAAWVTPLDALAACRVPGPPQEPAPLPYLARSEPWGLRLDLAVDLRPAGAAQAHTVSRTGFEGVYWQLPQQVAHLTANGAALRTGDLLASGTVSGATRGSEGSLMELTRAGSEPLQLDGVERSFLQDGDEVVLRGSASVDDGVTLTLGEVRGVVQPARSGESGAGAGEVEVTRA